jgi:NitT/TauT family transport system permease protein
MTDTLAPPAPAAHPRGQDRPASPPTGQFARLAALGASAAGARSA